MAYKNKRGLLFLGIFSCCFMQVSTMYTSIAGDHRMIQTAVKSALIPLQKKYNLEQYEREALEAFILDFAPQDQYTMIKRLYKVHFGFVTSIINAVLMSPDKNMDSDTDEPEVLVEGKS